MTITDWIAETAVLRARDVALVEGDEAGGRRRVAGWQSIVEAIERGRGRRELWRGRRVGLHAGDGIDFVLQGLEIMASGACFFPIAAAVRGETLEALVRRVKLHGLVEGGDWQSCAGGGAVDGAGDEVFRSLSPAYIRFTSGTTSASKGVVLGAEAVVARIRAANRGLGIGPDDRVLWVLPMAHHWVVSILLYLAHGACVLMPSGGAGGARALARRERATVLYGAPHDYALLADGGDPGDWPALRLAVCAAGMLGAGTAAQARRALGRPLVQALGVIEAGLPCINLAGAEAKPLSVGRPLPDYDVVLRDERGRPVSGCGPESCGEIHVRGPGLFAAYLDPWRLFAGEEFATGDQGWCDAEGDLFLVGRRSNRIHCGGMKFFCEEVEAALERHPAVRACRVSGEPHPRLGEVPVAEIELEAGHANPGDEVWRAFLEGTLPPHMIPVGFSIVGAIARTPTGKIRRW